MSCGANVDAEDCRGRTALSHAARYGSLDCIAVLAAHNADVFHEDKDGRTPLEIAEDCARFEAAAQLKRSVGFPATADIRRHCRPGNGNSHESRRKNLSAWRDSR